MKNFKSNKELQITVLITLFSIITIIYAFIIDDIKTIFNGLYLIITSKCTLVTDYFYIGGFGATLVNCGLGTLFCLGLYKLSKAKLDGASIAALLTFAAHTFFGKNILNIWPIFIGSLLHCLIFKKNFKSIINLSIFTTALAPLVTEAFFIVPNMTVLNLFVALGFGIIIGIITPLVSLFTPQCHQSYQLYNSGFACGIIGIVFAAIFKFFDHPIEVYNLIDTTKTTESNIYIIILVIFFIIYSLIINPKGITSMLGIIKTNKTVDYTEDNCISTVLFNMSFLALIYIVILTILKANISGPVVGGLLAIIAFSTYGKTIFNTVFISIGVILFASFEHISFTDIRVLLAILFGTCLAPIINKYGILTGILTGILHLCVITNASSFHSGLNLYNNGFAAGLLCIFLVPILDAFKERFPNSLFWFSLDNMMRKKEKKKIEESY